MITSHATASHFLPHNSNQWDVIAINNSDTILPKAIITHAKNKLRLVFDDIDCPLTPYVMPNFVDVRLALDFSPGKERLLVTCHSGMTRAAAIAYAIKCQECGDPKTAITILNNNHHYPNRMVVKLAAQILSNPLILKTYEEWVKPVTFNVPDSQ